MDGGVKNRANIDEANFSQILQIKLPESSKENVINVIRQLEKVEGILWAGPNHYDRPAATPPSATVPATGIHRYPNLWGMHGGFGIQAEEAWNFTTGVRNNVRVGVIDSGMDNHADIAANRVNEGGDFVNMTNVNQNIPGPLRADPDGHGTHVSGTIAATGANANGVTGVAWNVQLIPLQVSFWDAGEADWLWDVAAVTRAITWATNNNIDVINYSGGGTSDNVARRNAIGNFQGLFVCAAGNNSRSNEDNTGTNNRIYYPSDYSRNQTFSGRVISVGAINNAGTRPNFSNWGATSVSIFAPGNGIWSTVPNAINATGYASWNGTSMATPHVTGTAALMYSLYTSMNSNLTRAQRAAAIKTAIINNAVTNDTNTPLNGLCVANGRLNAFRAISSIAFTTTNIGANNIRIDSLQTNLRTFITGELVLPDTINNRTVTEIGSSAFANSGMSQISIPASITSIGQNAFTNCHNLTTINIPDERLVNVTDTGEVYRMAGNAPIYVTLWDNIGGEAGKTWMNIRLDFFNLLRQYPMDGTIVTDHFGDVYVFAGGAPLYVTNWNNIGGIRANPAVDGISLRTHETTGKFSHVRQYPMDGTVVTDHFLDVYVFAGGAPIYVTNWNNIGGIRANPAVDGISLRTHETTGKFSHVRQYPMDGTVVRGGVNTSTHRVYVFAGGAPLYVTSWNNIGGERPFVDVDEVTLNTFTQTGKFSHVRQRPLDGTLVSTIHGYNYKYVGGVASYYSLWSVLPPYTLVDSVSL